MRESRDNTSGVDMHIALRVLDLTIETDADSDDPGDCVTTAVGFTRTEAPPLEAVLPDWR